VYREVHTGVELWERSHLQHLREAVRRREVEGVIIHAIDRLARDPVHLGVILSEADHAGATVEFVTEVVDDSPEGQLIRFVRGYAAKIEHEKIKERAMRGIRHRVDLGHPLAGRKAPYGYHWLPDLLDGNGKALVVKPGFEEDPGTDAVVRRIFAEIAAGSTLRALAMALTSEQIPTPTGRPTWQHTTLRAILMNPVYAGRPMAFRGVQTTVRTNVGRKKVMRARPETEHVALPEGTAPALVDETTFQAAQQRLRLNRERSPRNNRAPEQTLLRGGFIRCGYCGSAMIVRRGKVIRYRCGRSLQPNLTYQSGGIAVRQIDAAAWERVATVLQHPEIVAEELARLQQDDPTDADLAAVNRELTKIERHQQNLVNQLAELGGAVAAMVTAKLTSLQAEAAACRWSAAPARRSRGGAGRPLRPGRPSACPCRPRAPPGRRRSLGSPRPRGRGRCHWRTP
jgi:site-specific DNA recombinase